MAKEQADKLKDISISTMNHDEFTEKVRKVARHESRIYAVELERTLPSFVSESYKKGVIEGILTFSDAIADRTVDELIRRGYIKKA